MCAADLGYLDIVLCLIQHGANVNVARKDNNYTPLHYACDSDVVDVMQALITNGADTSALTWNGRTALHMAIHKGSGNAAVLLLQSTPALVNTPVQDETKDTPLHIAVANNNQEMVELLLAYDADLSGTL
jgi:ankyrin repeat protein